MRNECHGCTSQVKTVVDMRESSSVSVQSLLRGRSQLAIEHEGRYYILSVNRKNELVLSR